MSDPLNFGPLTETWTPPQSCDHKVAQSTDFLPGGTLAPYAAGFTCSGSIGSYCTGNSSPFWISLAQSAPSGYDCVYATSFASALDSSCWPNSKSSKFFVSGYYSPGFVCPSGHTTACLSTSGGSYNFQFDFALASGATAAGCCPSNYICAVLGNLQTCIYTATHTDDFVSICSNTISSISAYAIPTSTRVEAGQMGNYITTYIVQQVLYAPMYRLNWHSSDLPASTTTNNNTDTTPVTPYETTAMSSETSSAISDGLSKSARGGIGAGVGVGVLAIIGLIGWFVLARRRAKKVDRGSTPPQTTPEHSGFEKAEMPGQQSWAHELPHITAEPGGPGEAISKFGAVPGRSSAENQVHELGQ